MDNFVNMGESLEILATSTIIAGELVVTNEVVGIAFDDIVDTERGNVAIEGVYRLAKDNGTAINEGDLVDWDVSALEVTKGITPASGDVVNFGICMKTEAQAATLINVKLMPGIGAITA